MLKSHNGGFLKAGDTLLSTVMLPIQIEGDLYETCLFIGGDSEVLQRYRTISEAANYHTMYEKRYGLNRA